LLCLAAKINPPLLSPLYFPAPFVQFGFRRYHLFPSGVDVVFPTVFFYFGMSDGKIFYIIKLNRNVQLKLFVHISTFSVSRYSCKSIVERLYTVEFWFMQYIEIIIHKSHFAVLPVGNIRVAPIKSDISYICSE